MYIQYKACSRNACIDTALDFSQHAESVVMQWKSETRRNCTLPLHSLLPTPFTYEAGNLQGEYLVETDPRGPGLVQLSLYHLPHLPPTSTKRRQPKDSRRFVRNDVLDRYLRIEPLQIHILTTSTADTISPAPCGVKLRTYENASASVVQLKHASVNFYCAKTKKRKVN